MVQTRSGARGGVKYVPAARVSSTKRTGTSTSTSTSTSKGKSMTKSKSKSVTTANDATVSNAVTEEPFDIFSLPLEVRRQIYGYVFEDLPPSLFIIRPVTKVTSEIRSTALLHVSRDMYLEALPELYAAHPFRLLEHAMGDFLNTIGPRGRAAIAEIHIERLSSNNIEPGATFPDVIRSLDSSTVHNDSLCAHKNAGWIALAKCKNLRKLRIGLTKNSSYSTLEFGAVTSLSPRTNYLDLRYWRGINWFFAGKKGDLRFLNPHRQDIQREGPSLAWVDTRSLQKIQEVARSERGRNRAAVQDMHATPQDIRATLSELPRWLIRQSSCGG